MKHTQSSKDGVAGVVLAGRMLVAASALRAFTIVAGACALAYATAAEGAADESKAFRLVPAPKATGSSTGRLEWKSEIPADCPFGKSTNLTGIVFTGRHSDYRCGDTWYPCWADDGNLYSPWTDGNTAGIACSSAEGANASTGHAVMIGDDPLNLTIRNTSPPKKGSASPYIGRYPAGYPSGGCA
ncbi:MAG: hypothetical protein WCL44_13590 [bacterium]